MPSVRSSPLNTDMSATAMCETGGFMLIRFARYRKHRKLVKERRWKIDDKPLFACDDCTFLDQIRRAGSARACWQGLNHHAPNRATI